MIHKAEEKDLAVLTNLAMALWPSHAAEEMEAELSNLLQNSDAALFVACEGTETFGFAQCQLRKDYVEGTESSPVGYLEGIYVSQSHRGCGVAKKLLSACENWAREQGCREFASDCELDNAGSQAFHLKMGFAEANRIICFTKRL